ncbi:MAG: hypothetical protein K1X71_10635 [Pirellulales bacterium]|nr:hypothetical protein [Pirellulales bacterium]
MTDADMLRAIKTQTLALITEITATPKPSYSIDGQAVAWADYLARLQEVVAWCDARLAAEEPFEIHSRGCT